MARQSKYTLEVLAEAVAASNSIAGVLRHLGIPASGGMHAHVSRRIKFFDLDTTHFTGQGHRLGQSSPRRLPFDEILVVRPLGAGRAKPRMLRRALVDAGVPYRCDECDMEGLWCGRPIVLHVDHIDGNYLNCSRENLRFLCPNCHTQTATWAGKNRRNIRYRVPPETHRPILIEEVLCLFEDAGGEWS
jgi:predicted RNA-binding Zn-ribbon protein involved in translation (DUF1610 family)